VAAAGTTGQRQHRGGRDRMHLLSSPPPQVQPGAGEGGRATAATDDGGACRGRWPLLHLRGGLRVRVLPPVVGSGAGTRAANVISSETGVESRKAGTGGGVGPGQQRGSSRQRCSGRRWRVREPAERRAPRASAGAGGAAVAYGVRGRRKKRGGRRQRRPASWVSRRVSASGAGVGSAGSDGGRLQGGGSGGGRRRRGERQQRLRPPGPPDVRQPRGRAAATRRAAAAVAATGAGGRTAGGLPGGK